jgi:signal transduction histidine kinase
LPHCKKPIGKTGIDIIFKNDIVKAYGDETKAETKEGEFTEFSIMLPFKFIN